MTPVIRILPLLALLASDLAQTAQAQRHAFPTHYTLHALHADVVPLSTAEKYALADVVLEGEVVDTRSFWRDNRIASTLTVESRGDASRFTVELMGGTFDDMGAFCTGEMYLNTGAEGTFFLRGSHAEGWKPACGVQSYEPETRETWIMGVHRSTVELSTDWAAGNGMEMLTLSGAGFGAEQGNGYVTFETGNGYYGADAAANFHYSNWSDTSITIEVPQAQSNRVRVVTDDGTTLETTDSLHIRYNLDSAPYSAYGYTHLYNQGGDGGYVFHVQDAIFNEPERLEAVARTLEDFVCKTGVNVQLHDEPTSLGWDLGDGQNTLCFDSPESPLSPGTVGYCNTLWWSCILGDVTFYVAGEIDIVLNSAYDFDYGTGWPDAGQSKFAYVLMHELGHAMRLGHVNEWGETMYPSVTDWPSETWNVRDTISTFDRLGVSHAVDIASTFTFGGCGIAPMEPLDIDCTPVVEIAEVGVESSNDAPYPNPFSGFIALPNPEAGGTWTLLDGTGKAIRHIPGTAASIDTDGLPAGSYLLRRDGQAASRTYRLVKTSP